MADDRIGLSDPHLSGGELAALQRAIASGWLTTQGPEVEAFEREVARTIGVSGSLAVCSGTAALHLALRVLGVGPGDRVVCSTLTFVASVAPVLYLGAQPVFIDSGEDSWNIDPHLLGQFLERAARRGCLPRCVVATDLFGQCADYTQLQRLCDRFGLRLIEDAAEALGAEHSGRQAGSFGDAAVLSFNGNKMITTTGGGMIVSDSVETIDRARHLATHAKERAPYYEHLELGFNYGFSNLLAAFGRAQLAGLADRVARRRAINRFYRDELGDLPGLEFMPEAAGDHGSHWLTALTVDPDEFGCTAEELCRALASAAIAARRVWKPMHCQPLFDGCEVSGGTVAERLFDRGLVLPSGSGLTDSELERVVAAVRARSR